MIMRTSGVALMLVAAEDLNAGGPALLMVVMTQVCGCAVQPAATEWVRALLLLSWIREAAL
jgi:hypothetical protein